MTQGPRRTPTHGRLEKVHSEVAALACRHPSVLHPSLFLLLWEAAVFLTVCLLPDPPCCSRKPEGESVESGGDRKAGTTLFHSKQGET